MSVIGVVCEIIAFGSCLVIHIRDINPQTLQKRKCNQANHKFGAARNPSFLDCALQRIGWELWLDGVSPTPITVRKLTDQWGLTLQFVGL
ncbi:hypothetical protein VNO77_40866 [Canavalia gladiata]|uniref:Uncharacterized protein n=1 Tax=Canavalia gladiata TaxID=3824 RepID=A0AAN9K1V3_CANGL